jgi:hypothetical protein
MAEGFMSGRSSPLPYAANASVSAASSFLRS